MQKDMLIKEKDVQLERCPMRICDTVNVKEKNLRILLLKLYQADTLGERGTDVIWREIKPGYRYNRTNLNTKIFYMFFGIISTNYLPLQLSETLSFSQKADGLSTLRKPCQCYKLHITPLSTPVNWIIRDK